MNEKWLLCDFHIHTDISDGKLPMHEIIDLYGNEGFDAISITDHVYDKHTVKLWRDNNDRLCTIPKDRFSDYMHMVWQEAKRAWENYHMIVIPGIEITNNHDLFHMLAIDIKEYIDPDQTVEPLIEQIHNQDAIAIALPPTPQGFRTGNAVHTSVGEPRKVRYTLRRLGSSQSRQPFQCGRP